MKKILKSICAVFISVFTLLSVACLLYSYLTSPRLLLGVVKKMEYYEEAHTEIIRNLEHQIMNEQIKEGIHSVITEEKVENDVERMIHSLFNKKNIKSTIETETKLEIETKLKEILNGEKYEQSSFDELVRTLTKSYMKDLFPYNEYKKLQNKFIAVSYLLPMGCFFLLMALLMGLVSILLSPIRKIEAIYRANIFSGVLMICPFCFCHLYRLFKNFYYSNAYFSVLIRKTFYTMVDLLGMIGVLLLIITFALELREIFIKNKKKGK